MRLASYLPGTPAWRRRRQLRTCREAYERVQELVDGEVEPGPQTDTLLGHIEACGPCAVEADAVREIKRAISRVGAEVDPEVVRRLEDWARKLCDSDGEPPDPSCPPR
jgi:hypothetical protein